MKHNTKSVIIFQKSKKDLGIPNLWKSNQDLLKQIARSRELAKYNKGLTKEKETMNTRAPSGASGGVGGVPIHLKICMITR